MVVNPCCMRLQRAVKIMAVIDIVLDTLNLLTSILALIGVTALRDRLSHEITDSEVDVARGVLAFSVFLAVLGLLLSIRLLIGARRRDIRNCKIWIIMTCIILTINIISTIVNSTAGEVDTLNISISVVLLAYRLYMIWVVYAFIQELKLDATGMGFQARLEEGVGYSMQSYPPQYPQQQAQPTVFVYPAAPLHQQPPPPYGAPAQPATNGSAIYNSNNQYYTTGNI